jgi:hypothetical protein
MTAKGLRKCRAVDREENQKQVSRRRPRALGNRWSRFPHSRRPGHDRHGKVEIQKQDSHFPTATPCPNQTNQKRKEIDPSPKPCPSGSSQDRNMLDGSRPFPTTKCSRTAIDGMWRTATLFYVPLRRRATTIRRSRRGHCLLCPGSSISLPAASQ